MGDTAEPQETVSTKPTLKYLGFLPEAFLKLTACITHLYDCAKDSAGPLKPGVDSVEGTVRTVVGPVYQKIEGKPMELLVFVDRKVGDIVVFLDGVLPLSVKEGTAQVYDAAKSTALEAKSNGVYVTAKTYFDKYEPVAESYGIKAYKKALTIPLVPQLVVVTRYGAVKVNQIIATLKDSGLPLASYLPLFPVGYFDEIAKSD